MLFRCRRQDLNLHWVNLNQALNLACLPIPPLRRGFRLPLLAYREGEANQESAAWSMAGALPGKARRKKNLRLCRLDAFENPQCRWVPQTRFSDPTQCGGLASAGSMLAPCG